MRRSEFLDVLSRRPILLDGAMGTQLFSAGLEQGKAPEAWLIEQPEKIKRVHASYDEAGSDAVYTCSFGGTRIKLAASNVLTGATEINRKAVEIARAALWRARWVFGSMGPTGALLEPYGDLAAAAAKEAFVEQAAALAAAGADALVVESFIDLNEAVLAVSAARKAGDIFVLSTMTFEGEDKKFRTVMGTTPQAAAEALLSAGADAIGVNCGRGIEDAAAVVKMMREAAGSAPLIAKPNAGVPLTSGGRVVYPVGPAEFADKSLMLLDLGVVLLGGCCGTGPEHIRSLRNLPRLAGNG